MDYQENCYKRGTLPSKTYSRVEQYLRELCLLEDAPLPVPQSRIELLLEAIFTGDISKCESPKSREEKLIWALLTGDESDIEKCASRIEVLWYCLVKGLNAEELLGTEVNGKVIEDCMSRIEAYLWYLVKNGGSSLMGVEYELYDFVTTYNTISADILKAISFGETMVNIVEYDEGNNTFNAPTLESKEYTVQNDGTEFTLNNIKYSHGITEKTFDGGSEKLPTIPNGYSAEGYKSAILKGNTLMNYYKVERQESNDEQIWGDNELTSVYSKGTYFIKNNTSHKILIGVYTIEPLVYADILYLEGGSHLKVELADDRCLYQFLCKFSDGWTSEDDLSNAVTILQYQDGMENWDIPYFEGMQSVKMPVLKTVGKNLFDKVGINANHAYCAKYEWKGSDLHITTNGDQYNSVSFITEIKAGDYTISVSEHTYIKVVNLGDNSVIFEQTLTTKTFKVLNDCKIRIYFFANLSSTSITTKVISNIQLERGAQATTYEPYKSNILTTPEEVVLRSVENAQDTINLNTGEYVQRIGEVILNGSEPWEVLDNNTENTIGFTLHNVLLLRKTGDKYVKVNCDKLPSYKENLWNNDKIGCVAENNVNQDLNDTQLQVRVLKSALSTQDTNGFKSWLQTNPLIIQYILETPTIKTVDLSIVNQDGEALDKLKYFNNGHIFIESESINPSMTYEPDINKFKGTVNVGTVTNNVLTATDKDIVIVEGDKTDCYIPKFKGMVSCTDMCLEIENEDGSSVLSQYPVNKDVVIRKIKDIEDTFNYLTGEYTRRIGEITFDGSENWETSITSNGKFIGIVYIENGELSNIYDDKEYQWNNGYLFCKDPYLGNLNSCWLHKVDNNTTQFRLMLDGTQTLADEFKEYVTNNPITIQYALAEPIVTKVDVNLTKDDMRSFEGITKFRVKNNDSKLFPSKTVVTVRTSNDTDLALLSDEISTLSVKQNDTSNTISNTSEDIENVSNGLNEINSLLE